MWIWRKFSGFLGFVRLKFVLRDYRKLKIHHNIVQSTLSWREHEKQVKLKLLKAEARRKSEKLWMPESSPTLAVKHVIIVFTMHSQARLPWLIGHLARKSWQIQSREKGREKNSAKWKSCGRSHSRVLHTPVMYVVVTTFYTNCVKFFGCGRLFLETFRISIEHKWLLMIVNSLAQCWAHDEYLK